MDAPVTFTLNALLPDRTMQVHLPLQAPQALGTYTSVWQIRQPDERQLGNAIVLQIDVQDMPTATPFPLPTTAVTETPPTPLVLPVPELTTWQNIPDSSNWQGTLHLQATGGTGIYRYFNGDVREERLINGDTLTLVARRCEGLTLDIWVLSGVEVHHLRGEIPYPDQELCE